MTEPYRVSGWSSAEQQAQDWHHDKRHTEQGHRKCWCCCVACRAASPHYLAAKAASLRDIARRLNESMAAIRLPDRRNLPLLPQRRWPPGPPWRSRR